MAGVRTLRLDLVGHLTRASLDASFDALAPAFAQTGNVLVLVVDCRRMTGYDGTARERFVAWNAAHRHRLAGVAVLTEKVLWHMIVGTMALASGQRMRAFFSEQDASAWLDATTLAATSTR